MYGMLTKIVVKPGKRPELLEYLRWDAEVAKANEPGTWRFDVWETEHEPGVVYLYEAYKDRAAFEDHAKNDPYKKWNEVADKTMVRDVMTPVVFSIRPDAPARQVIEEMLHLRVHRLFVIDRDGVLVGVIAMSDILRRLLD